jgi:hypothetical protein
VIKEHSVFGQFFFGSNPSRAEREEKVLRYIIHRMNEDVPLHGSQVEIGEIAVNPELVHAAREHMEQAFGLGELAPDHQRRTSEES